MEQIISLQRARFERVFTALLAILSGVILILLAVQGPLFLDHIHYKTAEVINNQLLGQDIVNLLVLAPLLIAGGISLLLKKRYAIYLLLMAPLYLIYYVLSYTIGWEWSSNLYTGNNEKWFFHFLFILISSVIILFYALAEFPEKVQSHFKRKHLLIYTLLNLFFMLIFAGMWISEVREVIATGTARGYDIAPTAFWLVRVFDLGFTIPLGILSIYLLWTRPDTTFPVQFMFYGFFLTMIIAVNAMGVIMLLNNDPTFLFRDLSVFLILGAIISFGFGFILKNYRTT
ncbi:MAG: hypothetical protein GXY59_10205 [Bacteroidales bacterium]|jgi:hypothetical protein|nr:hypothetical protein [Bacteroidales bacterium]